MLIRGLPPTTLLRMLSRRPPRPDRPRHVFLCIADHWEPKWNSPGKQVEADRVARWVHGFPQSVAGLADSRGRPPQHTFFYPEEEYEPEYLEAIAGLCHRGYGDVEVHLHHDNDTSDGLREKLDRFTHLLHAEHGLLRKDADGRIAYGFIHGNWALDNSRPDGRWCGVNSEISVLIETGCYADFTMPSAPDPCQTATINSIYYATDDPLRPKSHDTGALACVNSQQSAKSLLLIQGPLALNWRQRKWGVLPRIENGDLTGKRPPTMERLVNWIAAGVSVSGREDWLFVKLHTHGAQESNADMLLGEPMRQFHEALASLAGEQDLFRYYYVTASEMASLVHAAERGECNPATVLDANPAAASPVSAN